MQNFITGEVLIAKKNFTPEKLDKIKQRYEVYNKEQGNHTTKFCSIYAVNAYDFSDVQVFTSKTSMCKSLFNKPKLTYDAVRQTILVTFGVRLTAYATGTNIHQSTLTLPKTIVRSHNDTIIKVRSTTVVSEPYNYILRDDALYAGSGRTNATDIFAFLHEDYLYLQRVGAVIATAPATPTDPVTTTAPAAAPAATTTEPEAAKPDALTVLQGMLVTAQTNAIAAEAKATKLQQDFDVLSAQATAFTEIARNSVKTMGLHFGVSAETVAAMSGAEVLAAHSRLAELFKAKYPGGRVAATTQQTDAASKATFNPLFTAVLSSTTRAN